MGPTSRMIVQRSTQRIIAKDAAFRRSTQNGKPIDRLAVAVCRTSSFINADPFDSMQAVNVAVPQQHSNRTNGAVLQWGRNHGVDEMVDGDFFVPGC